MHRAHGLPLSRSSHDRDAVSRSEGDLLERLWNDPSTRVVVIHENQSLVAMDTLVLLRPEDVGTSTRIYLGRDGDTAFVGVFTDSTHEAEAALAKAQALAEDVQWRDLRHVGSILNDRDTGLFVQALALAHWHRSRPFAPGSGTPTEPDQSGWVRVASDGVQVFPRTDPAVIVLVRDADDRILLGNNALWEPHRFSLLAGYVEPGESLEDAAVREIFEECGLLVENPTYVASQPWPFPASLMMGFSANLAPGQRPEDARADGEEIRELRWFSREDLKNSLDEVLLPGPVAIARHLIEVWLGERLPQEDTWTGKR